MPDKVTKPQSPIRNGDEGIYPLTTFDQIIMADGSRWNGVVLSDDIVDPNNIPVVDFEGTEADNLVPINAQTLDGLTYKQIIELEHGIGSFYFTMNAADDPNNKWNWMTWELVTDKFLLGAGNLYEGGTEGGEAEHVLTISELAAHQHVIRRDMNGVEIGLGGGTGTGNSISGTFTNTQIYVNSMGASSTGGSQPHNNMPPYLSIFMWTRVA